MKLRFALSICNVERLKVYLQNKKKLEEVESTSWKEYLSYDVESITSQTIEDKAMTCLLLRSSTPRFVKLE